MIKPWWRFSLCFQNDSSRCHFFTLYTILLLKASTCLFLLLQPAFKKKKKKSREQIVKHSREKRFGKSSYFKNVLSKTLIRLSPYSLFSFCLKIFFRVQLIYNVVLVSGAQQSESAIHIHICTLFQILFPCRSEKDKYSLFSDEQGWKESQVCSQICQGWKPRLQY